MAEYGTLTSDELRRKKRIKLAIHISAFAVFQTIVILVFALIVMRVKTPKVRLGTNITEEMKPKKSQASPYFDLSFTTQVGIKNTNFGPYKYDSNIATFMYQGVTIGQVTIPKGKAGLRSTKKVTVTVNVNSNALSSTTVLGIELGAGVLALNGQAKLSGKVELMFVMKKKKSVEMNCSMTIDLSSKAIQSMICE
ncbi:late embryogenesis abundant protein At1g64065-like [Quercus robur]|uniref:late embryogenesis abundant protein At1g64065-like n=1 Tax=Quercus robur TaxID=38942 RepID=UPI0021637063|nr:late embryogenesis abundant protein At1g64065-like [Quercus robur]